MESFRTLPQRQLINGLAETIKHACLGDAELFTYLEHHWQEILACDSEACTFISERNCAVKYKVVMKDEREHNLREILNLGHTVGRAIETVSGYRLLHGEALSIGMTAQVNLGCRCGYLTGEERDRVVALQKKIGLPVTIPDYIDKEELVKTYEQIKAALGSCDILINGAGGNQPGAIASVKMLKKEKQEDDYSFWDLKEENIRNVMDLNYMGTLLPIQVFTRDMVEKRKGSIINIASVSSILPLSKVMAYSNAKSAVQSLTQWLAIHFGQSGIRCNAIVPGFYAAEQNHDLLFNKDGSYTDRAGDIIAGTPMGRFGNPEELIGAALFLASDDAAGFVNGIVLPVDGGYSAFSGV